MSCADHLFLHSEDGEGRGGGFVLLVEVNIKELE